MSPPCGRKRNCKGVVVIAQQTADRVSANAVANALLQPRGAYAPRSWSRAFVHRRNCDFYDAQTHMHRSGGRQPAVAGESHLQRRFSTQSREYIARAHERRVSVRYAFRKHACRGDSASTTGDRRRCADKHHCSRGFRPTAGLRPLLLYPPRNAIPEQLRNALASASPDSPRRAYARRSWIGYSPFATRDSPFATRYC